MSLLEEIKENVVRGHINKDSNYPPDLKGKSGVEDLVEEAISQNLDVGEILHNGLIGGMDIVGEKFSNGEYFVPEMLFSAKAMKSGLKILRPHLVEEKIWRCLHAPCLDSLTNLQIVLLIFSFRPTYYSYLSL